MTHVDVELPVEAPVDVQAILELSAGEQTLSEHGGEEHRQRVVVAEPGNLDAHLYPAVLALTFPVAVAVLVAVAHVDVFLLAQHRPLRRLFHLGLHAHERLCPVFEGYARTAVCTGEHIVLGAHGAEVARAFGDIEAEGRGLAKGGAQEGQLGGREVDEIGLGRHVGGRQWLWASFPALVMSPNFCRRAGGANESAANVMTARADEREVSWSSALTAGCDAPGAAKRLFYYCYCYYNYMLVCTRIALCNNLDK